MAVYTSHQYISLLAAPKPMPMQQSTSFSSQACQFYLIACIALSKMHKLYPFETHDTVWRVWRPFDLHVS